MKNTMARQGTLFGMGLLALSAFAEASAQDLVIRAARVETVSGQTFEPGEVLVSQGKIVEVGTSVRMPDGAPVEDIGSGTLIPGLVDPYSHTGIAGGSSEYTLEVTPSFTPLSALDWDHKDFARAMWEGTTTLNVAPGTENVVAGIASVVKTGGDDRLVARRSSLFVTMADDATSRNRARTRPDNIYVRQPTNRMGIVWILRSALHQAGREGTVGPMADALAGDLPVYAVARTSYDIRGLLEIAREFRFRPVVVGGEEAYKVLGELADAQVPVILAPLTTGSSTGQDGTELAWNQPGMFSRAGVSFAFSGGRLLEQARFATRFGLDRQQALAAITLAPARLLGLDERVGSVAPGRDADLVALDGDPLELTTSVRWVMIDGVIHRP